MANKNHFPLLFSFLFLISCSPSMEDKGMAMESMEEAPALRSPEVSGGTQTDLPSQTNTADRKIIWTGDMEFQVKNVDKSTKKILDIVKQYGGFVSGMDMGSDHYNVSNNITIRIESVKFQDLINSIKGESLFMRSLTVRSNDVTEEFIDIESRLKTKKEVRDRYIAILTNRTGKISEVLEAEEAIRKITEEIEAQEGRLRYLRDKVRFSTLNVVIYQEVEFTDEPTVYIKPYGEKALEALSNGWSIITGLALILLNIWPFVLAIAVMVVWKRKWFNKRFGGGK